MIHKAATATIARRRQLAAIADNLIDHVDLAAAIASFKGAVVKCEAGAASGTDALQTKRASAMRMGFYKGTRFGG